MNFWKRFRLIGSTIVLLVSLLAFFGWFAREAATGSVSRSSSTTGL